MSREKKTPAVRLAIVRKQLDAARAWVKDLEKRESVIIAEAKDAAKALLARVEA